MIADMPARRVRLLRLTAPDEALARRGALLLEDALRTATLPGGDDGRLIVVRSLALGTIDSRGSSASVALALEQGWRRLAASAVHAEDPAAPHQPAVYFRDRAEALTLLAVRLAAGRDARAWFWPLAVPGWRPGVPAGDASRLVLAAALDGAVPAAALLSLVAALLDRGALSPLLAALRPGDGPALLAALGLTRPARPASGRAADLILPPLTPAWTSILARWVRAWGAQDARSAWLAALALAVEAPARLLDPEFVARAERLAALAAQSEPAPAEAHTPPATPHETVPHASPAAERDAATEGGPPQPPAAGAQPAHTAARAPQPDTARAALARPRPAAPAQIDAEQPAGHDQPAPAPAKAGLRRPGRRREQATPGSPGWRWRCRSCPTWASPAPSRPTRSWRTSICPAASSRRSLAAHESPPMTRSAPRSPAPAGSGRRARTLRPPPGGPA